MTIPPIFIPNSLWIIFLSLMLIHVVSSLRSMKRTNERMERQIRALDSTSSILFERVEDINRLLAIFFEEER